MNQFNNYNGHVGNGSGYPSNLPPYTPPQPGQIPPPLYRPYNEPPPAPPLYRQPYYGYSPPPNNNPVKTRLRRNANILATGLVLLFFVMMVVSLIPSLLMQALIPPERLVEWYQLLDQCIMLVSYGLSFGIALLVIKQWLKIPAKAAFPMKRPKFSIAFPAIFVCLGLNIIGSVCYSLLSQVLESVFGIVSTSPDFAPPHGIMATLLYCLSLTLFPAIMEELVFRGVVMQSLRRFGDGFALITSAILFSLLHGNLVQAVPAFLVGLSIGYFVLRTGSLLTGMIIHFVNNSIVVVIELMTRSATDDQLIVVNSIVMICYVATGVLAMVFLLKQPNMFRLAPSGCPLKESKKYLYFFTSVMPIIFVLAAVVMTALYFE